MQSLRGVNKEIARTEQLNALAASRQAILDTGAQERTAITASTMALKSMLAIASKQESVLENSLQAARNQLSIIRDNNNRELARADVGVELFYPEALRPVLRNSSKIKLARDVQYQLRMLNLDHATAYSFQSVSSKTHFLDFIQPSEETALEKLDLDSVPPTPALEPGDRLFGYLSVRCSDCERERIYWVYWRYGLECLYYEGLRSDYRIQRQLQKEDADEMVQKFMKHGGLTVVPFRYE